MVQLLGKVMLAEILLVEARKERNRASARAHYLANRERCNANSRAYYRRNAETVSARGKAWRKANPELDAAIDNGVDPATVTPKPTACQVCGAGGKICLDHDHQTKTFRGWLCHHCNCTIGYAKDDAVNLRALADYLENHHGC